MFLPSSAHVAYPDGDNLEMDAEALCPQSHPVKVPRIFMERHWDVAAFTDAAHLSRAKNRTQRALRDSVLAADPTAFVLANGDTTGYGCASSSIVVAESSRSR